MAEPKVLKTLKSHVESKDNPHEIMEWINTDDSENPEESEQTIPVDANTLEGHPANYFASKTEVSQILSRYIATVLGRSY